jgi:hypothetical protein
MLDLGDFSPLELNDKSIGCALRINHYLVGKDVFAYLFIAFPFVVEIARHIL